MAAILKQYGGNYQNRVPYTAILNSSGKVTREWTGVTDYHNYSYWIEKVLEANEEESETLPPSQWEFIGPKK